MPAPLYAKYRLPSSSTAASELHDHAAAVGSSSMIRSFAEKSGKVYLLYGERPIFQLSLQMAAHAMADGNPIAVVDGCNRFDVHTLSRFARMRKIDPNKFLSRIFISRGFTCYQMEQAIARKLPVFLTAIHSKTALIFGLLDTFYDEQARLGEVQQILQRLLVSFQNMKATDASLLLVCMERTVAPPERNQLFATLKSGVDRVYKLDGSEQGTLRLFLESQRTTPAVKLLTKGDLQYGTNRTNLHQPDRSGIVKLDKVSPRAAQRRSGSIR
jgi:hypothetical protein